MLHFPIVPLVLVDAGSGIRIGGGTTAHRLASYRQQRKCVCPWQFPAGQDANTSMYQRRKEVAMERPSRAGWALAALCLALLPATLRAQTWTNDVPYYPWTYQITTVHTFNDINLSAKEIA